ncbi:MAG: EAL domain-containing protein [Treponemataceae bacterium]|nr:EAL domain-containing protein [Treponemataceae bacterium]
MKRKQTITLAKKLNMKIVAEGIETREQVDFLKQNGCDLIQGFYFAKPLPVGEFEKRAFSRQKLS